MAGVQQMDEVDLEGADRDLTVHELNPENELTEISHIPIPNYGEEITRQSQEFEKSYSEETVEASEYSIQKTEVQQSREYRFEVVKSARTEATVSSVAPEEPVYSTEQRIEMDPAPPTSLQYEPTPVISEPAASPKKAKKVTISFPTFGRKPHQDEVGHDVNGDSPSPTREQRGPDSAVTLTLYPRRLLRPNLILRIIELLLGIIVCSATNAEQCFFLTTMRGCVSPSSITWGSQLGGIGYVLFVGVVFILGNFAWIFYHIYSKPVHNHSTQPRTRFGLDDKAKLAEVIYDGFAVVMYIISASVAAWYASFIYWPFGNYNPYRPQWIAATVFAWINTGVYSFGLAYSLLWS